MNLGWKTITGALVYAVGILSAPEVLAVLPEKEAKIAQAVGAALAIIGGRHALAKLGAEQPPAA